MKTKENTIDKILTIKHYLYHFWPELMPRSEEVYEHLIQNKQKSLEELWLPDADLLPTIKTKNEQVIAQFLGKQPIVFCAFHLGGYRIPTRYLIKNNIPHSIVMNINSQDAMSSFDQKVLDFLQQRDKTEEVSIINIAKRSALIEIIQLMRDNKALLIYPDANLNTQNSDTAKNMVEVSFFGQKLNSQVGAAFFSHKFKAPIIPIVTYRKGNDNYMAFQSPILPQGEDRGTYYQGATQKIWSILEKYVQKYPLQWEGWLFAGKRLTRPEMELLNTAKSAIGESSKFNTERYEFAEKENEFFLFDLATKKMISVTKDLFEFLKKLKLLEVNIDNKVLTKILNQPIFRQMHALGILK